MFRSYNKITSTENSLIEKYGGLNICEKQVCKFNINDKNHAISNELYENFCVATVLPVFGETFGRQTTK